MKPITTKSVLLLALGLTACVGTDDGTDDSDIPCGMRDCSAAEVDPEWGPEFAQLRDGKADAAGVRTALVALTADGELDASDVLTLFDEAGRNLSESELEIIRVTKSGCEMEADPRHAELLIEQMGLNTGNIGHSKSCGE